jgi:phosphinothricin acetyltransferase
LTIRDALPDDMGAVTAIYAPAVRHGTASFELEPPDEAVMAQRRAAVVECGLPYLVCLRAGEIVGYAYAGLYRPRPSYRFTVEDSIYVAPEAKGGGIGTALMAALIERATAAGARQMLAVIGDPPNQPASVALHRRFGFVEAGLLRAVGWKFGAWRDTLLMARRLGSGSDTPATVATIDAAARAV